MKLLGEAPLRKKTGGPRTASAQQGPSGPGFWGGGAARHAGRRAASSLKVPSAMQREDDRLACIRTDRPSFFSPLLLSTLCACDQVVWPGLSLGLFFHVAESSLGELGVSRAVAGLHMVHMLAIRHFEFGEAERRAAAADRWSPKLLILECSDSSSRCIALLKSLNGEIENPPKLPTENKKNSGRDRLFP